MLKKSNENILIFEGMTDGQRIILSGFFELNNQEIWTH